MCYRRIQQTSGMVGAMRRLIFLILVNGLTGCTIAPQTYSNFGDNVVMIRALKLEKVRLDAVTNSARYSQTCGALAFSFPKAEDLALYIKNAFNAELKIAGSFSEASDAIRLRARLKSANFSTGALSGNGFWDISWELSGLNGRPPISVEEHYSFSSMGALLGDGADNCRAAASALVPAVQQLIHKTLLSSQANSQR